MLCGRLQKLGYMENSFLQKLDELVDRMPPQEFLEVSPNSRIIFTFNETYLSDLTISWQWALAKIGEALIARDARKTLELLFLELDYAQLHKNALSDIYNIVRQPVDVNEPIATQAQIDSFKNLMIEYLHQNRNNQPPLEHLINESSLLLEQIKSLEFVGIGAFMVASGFHLALLQEQAGADRSKWIHVKYRAIEDGQYAARVTPKLFKLSVGRIEKKCNCTCKSDPVEKRITEYECGYFDGKNTHLFRDISPIVLTECNRNRLQMFHNVVSSVNQTAVKPVRSAIKNWLKLAASI